MDGVEELGASSMDGGLYTAIGGPGNERPKHHNYQAIRALKAMVTKDVAKKLDFIGG